VSPCVQHHRKRLIGSQRRPVDPVAGQGIEHVAYAATRPSIGMDSPARAPG
jgi:hypothetical protein